MPLKSTRPSQLIASDITGRLPKTKNGHEYILVVVDHFSKWTQFYALKTMEAREVADKLVEYMLLNGIPDWILTDQGTNYQSLLLAEVYDLLDIHRFRTSP